MNNPEVMKNRTLSSILIAASCLAAAEGCTDIIVIECMHPQTTVPAPPSDQGGSGDNGSGGSGNTGLGSNLIGFHAAVESLNISTKSMSPISADTKVMIYAFHGSAGDATSTSAVARGLYTAQQTGMLTGDSGYKMQLSNGNFDFYAVSANSSAFPPVFTNGTSAGLSNGVDYLWWKTDNYDVAAAQVTVPIVLNHSATQVAFEIEHGDAMYIQDIVSATITASRPGAQMDLSTGIIPAATEYDAKPASMGINGLKIQYTMLPLKTDQPMKLVLDIHANGEPDVKHYEVDVPVPDGELAAGNSYRFKAVINADNVTFPQVGVTDWVDVDETGNPLYPH